MRVKKEWIFGKKNRVQVHRNETHTLTTPKVILVYAV